MVKRLLIRIAAEPRFDHVFGTINANRGIAHDHAVRRDLTLEQGAASLPPQRVQRASLAD